jgi:hypothetical protein
MNSNLSTQTQSTSTSQSQTQSQLSLTSSPSPRSSSLSDLKPIPNVAQINELGTNNKLRFQLELEFLELLANPFYLQRKQIQIKKKHTQKIYTYYSNINETNF